jgi:hypothetical protein
MDDPKVALYSRCEPAHQALKRAEERKYLETKQCKDDVAKDARRDKAQIPDSPTAPEATHPFSEFADKKIIAPCVDTAVLSRGGLGFPIPRVGPAVSAKTCSDILADDHDVPVQIPHSQAAPATYSLSEYLKANRDAANRPITRPVPNARQRGTAPRQRTAAPNAPADDAFGAVAAAILRGLSEMQSTVPTRPSTRTPSQPSQPRTGRGTHDGQCYNSLTHQWETMRPGESCGIK